MKLSRPVLIFCMFAVMRHAWADASAWDISIGVGGEFVRAYAGSDKYRIYPVPMISAEYMDGLIFIDTEDGAGSYFIRGENGAIGASLWLQTGRYEGADRQNLGGMGDIHFGPTFNLLGYQKFGPIKLSAKITAGTERYGARAKLMVGHTARVARPLFVYGRLGATFADARHMQTYYGVSTTQSSRTDYDVYHPHTGPELIEGRIGAVMFFSEHVFTNLMFQASVLTDDAAASPIVRRKFDPMVYWAVGYRF